MKTKEEKIKILAEAIKILAEQVDEIISGEEVPAYPPPSVTEWPSPRFDKYRARIAALHDKGYTTAGIARELGIATTNAANWVRKLGRTPNSNRKNAPGGYLTHKKALTGRKQKYVVPTTQEQNERLKVEQENAE
jgi:transposase-like protein